LNISAKRHQKWSL